MLLNWYQIIFCKSGLLFKMHEGEVLYHLYKVTVVGGALALHPQMLDDHFVF